MQRIVANLRTPMTARSALMQDEGVNYLSRGSSQSKPINSWEERLSLHRPGYIAKDETSLYKGRQRSNFIANSQKGLRAALFLFRLTSSFSASELLGYYASA